MRRAARAILVTLALVFVGAGVAGVSGCAGMVAQTPTYAQSVAQGYTTIAALRGLLAGLVQRDRIDVYKAIRIRDSINQVHMTLDVLSGSPDAERLASLQQALIALENQIMEANQ